jgi:hypothetical protein
VPWPVPFSGHAATVQGANWCAVPSTEAFGKDPRNLTGTHGQACFWCALAPQSDACPCRFVCR